MFTVASRRARIRFSKLWKTLNYTSRVLLRNLGSCLSKIFKKTISLLFASAFLLPLLCYFLRYFSLGMNTLIMYVSSSYKEYKIFPTILYFKLCTTEKITKYI